MTVLKVERPQREHQFSRHDVQGLATNALQPDNIHSPQNGTRTYITIIDDLANNLINAQPPYTWRSSSNERNTVTAAPMEN
ncbi:unnamed protein product [Heterotrigona itama]|uniref:Uncharacterized protein n=1 Tax=Heterotrigona itama TaxID=395501 RepID=A0A6V7H080_9HYME|nr:unnamed protein product [Heterotrigona itama]